MGLFERAMAGLGKGMSDIGETQLKAQVEEKRQMRLAQYAAQVENQKAQRDRGWKVEDRQEDRAWKEEDWDKTRAWDREKLGIQHGMTLSEIGARKSAAIEEHKAKGDYDRKNGGDIRGTVTDEKGQIWNQHKDGSYTPAMGKDPNTEYQLGSGEVYDGMDAQNVRKGLLNEGKERQLKERPPKGEKPDTMLNVRGIPTSLDDLNKRYNSWSDAAASAGDKIVSFRDWLTDIEGWDPQQADLMASKPGAGQQGAQGGKIKVGQVVDGYRFTGGNPKDPKNWESVR
jgi:hypothetical protein